MVHSEGKVAPGGELKLKIIRKDGTLEYPKVPSTPLDFAVQRARRILRRIF